MVNYLDKQEPDGGNINKLINNASKIRQVFYCDQINYEASEVCYCLVFVREHQK